MRTFVLAILAFMAIIGIGFGILLLVSVEMDHQESGAIHEIEALLTILIGTTALAGAAAGMKK